MTMRWDFVSEVLEWNVVFFSSAVFLGHVTRAKDFKRGINFSIFFGEDNDHANPTKPYLI